MSDNRITASRIDFEDLEALLPLDKPQEETKQEETPKIDINTLPVQAEEKSEQEETKEPSNPEPQVLGFNDGMNYQSMVQTYLKEGIWEDVIVDDEGTKLSEIQNLDRDDFLKIHKEQLKLKEQDLSKDKFDISEFDEQQKKVVELMKSGATPSEMKSVFDFQEKFINPLSKFDLEKETHAAQLVMYSIKNSNPSLSDETIRFEVQRLQANGTLFEKAHEIAEQINQTYNEKLDAMKQGIENSKKEKETKTENLIKELNKEMNEKSFKDSDKRAIRDFIRKDIDGNNLLKEIASIKDENPVKLSKLLLLLINEKEFQRVYGTPYRDKASAVLKRIDFSRKNSQNSVNIGQEESDGDTTDILKELKFKLI